MEILHSLNGCSRIRSVFAGLAGPRALLLVPRTPCLVSMSSGQCLGGSRSSCCPGLTPGSHRAGRDLRGSCAVLGLAHTGFWFLPLGSEVQHPLPADRHSREQGWQEQGWQEEGEMLLSRLGGGCWKSFLSVFLSGAGECPARSLERQRGQGFSNCICPVSTSSLGCDPPSWGTALSERGRIAVLGT